MQIRPVWFDSLGAKSMCVLVRTPDISLLIDPGAAIMQPNYPAPMELKLHYLWLARQALTKAAKDATHVAITHYHYDHFSPDLIELYADKTLWIKDPNRWINRSQWGRARDFLVQLSKELGIKFCERAATAQEFPDPVERLPLACLAARQDQSRQRQRFLELVHLWKAGPWVDEEKFNERVRFADGQTFRLGDTKVRFTPPLFHGTRASNRGLCCLDCCGASRRFDLGWASDLSPWAVPI